MLVFPLRAKYLALAASSFSPTFRFSINFSNCFMRFSFSSCAFSANVFFFTGCSFSSSSPSRFLDRLSLSSFLCGLSYLSPRELECLDFSESLPLSDLSRCLSDLASRSSDFSLLCPWDPRCFSVLSLCLSLLLSGDSDGDLRDFLLVLDVSLLSGETEPDLCDDAFLDDPDLFLCGDSSDELPDDLRDRKFCLCFRSLNIWGFLQETAWKQHLVQNDAIITLLTHWPLGDLVILKM